ncbi:MAG: response regulator, partial [candidate division Zixibacteria bacterium]|nr:response regulator [candidate division Zixibacteria bacterium]
MGYRANVLVVDDEQIVCDSCRKALSQHGHNVQTALNGREALRKVEQDKYDVLIADWKMPEIDGMEVLRIVKKNHPDIVVIMITGYPSVESAVKAMRLGVSNYVPKPLDPDELSRTLQKALEERKTGENDLFYYQKYIWARMLEDGTVEVGVNNLFRESVGDIMYVDLPCHETRAEHGRLFVRILAADKQMHKLCVPIRGRVVGINHEINFNTDLINKDPFGKGWIVRLEPFNLEGDLKNWSGNISIFSDGRQAELNSQSRVITSDSTPTTATGTEREEKIKEHLTQKPGRRLSGFRFPLGKFFLSALESRLFFLALLPICLGAISRAVLC